jgi:hypothetical protein
VFVTLGLLMGEYVDPVNLLLSDFTGMEAVSGWLIVGTLFYSLVGTLLTSALVAVILERLLRERLGVEPIRLPRRGPAPVLLVEGSALALRIAQRLRRHQQLVVRVESGGSDGSQDKGIVPFGQLEEALQALEGRPVSAVGLLSTDLRGIELGHPVPPRYRLRIQFHGALSPERRWIVNTHLKRSSAATS